MITTSVMAIQAEEIDELQAKNAADEARIQELETLVADQAAEIKALEEKVAGLECLIAECAGEAYNLNYHLQYRVVI